MWNIVLLRVKGEFSEELRKSMVDMSCLQEVRLRGQDSRMLEMEGKRYKLWWCRKRDSAGGMKEKLCEKVVEVRIVSGIVMAVVLVLKRMC